MTTKLGWRLLRHLQKVWVRVVSFAILGVITAIVSQVVAPFIPPAWTTNLGAEAVDKVLDVLTTSMLAVTTFSLAIAISAFAAAASSATPRATALLQQDPTAQNVLATFLGAFLFSLVGMIALQAGYYSNAGRLVLFVTTGIVIAAVVMVLLRWISHLMTFGRMGDTLDRVEAATKASLGRRLESPFLNGQPLLGTIPTTAIPVLSNEIGYIQHADIALLNTCAKELNTKIWLAALPGAFVHEARELLYVESTIKSDDAFRRLRAAFTIGAERNFDQDPRFGLIVLSEIASRALSPAVNDPGTAISVVGRLLRILARWKDDPEATIEYPSVFVPPVHPSDMIEDAFRPIIRDGAGTMEVQIRVRKALHALGTISPAVFGAPAAEMAAVAEARAREALTENEYRLLVQIPGPYPETNKRFTTS